jgi:hypothetical protein
MDPSMVTTQSSEQILDSEFLVIRAKILEIAAALDRIYRAGGTPSDQRLAKLKEGINILLSKDDNRAEQVQLLFSREFDENWRANLDVK